MKVLLINPSMGDYYRRSKVKAAITLSPPLNLALLAGALQRAGHAVDVWDLEAGELPDLERRLAEARPDMVGVTFRTPLFPMARQIAEAAQRACPSALRVAGGVHPSTRPEETVTRAPFDVAVRGEGDRSIVQLADGDAFEHIGGLTWPGGETPARPLIEDMDGLAYGAWERFDLSRYQRPSLVAPTVPAADLESSRGCRARCVYCTKGVFGNLWRVKSPGRMVDELEHAKAHGFRAFNFVDDSFTTITGRAIETCEEMLRRGLDMPWTLTNGIRVANVNEEFFRVARRAGCRLLAFGFESGSDPVLQRIKKGATVRQARRAVAWARKYDFTILGYFMVGLPGESAETIQETAAFAASLDVDFAKFSITMPLPGTPLYAEWAPHIRDANYDFSIHTPDNGLYDHPDFTWPELEAHTRRAYKTFYGRPRYVAKRVMRSLMSGQLRHEARYALELGAGGMMESFGRR
ncbi:MAG: cobalamin B12-binding domain-containing protein [Alphaproteobacteria bacterium]|nr:cobalamin B12-binding domain-containing protein [Alphaproteobacteria bacterium]